MGGSQRCCARSPALYWRHCGNYAKNDKPPEKQTMKKILTLLGMLLVGALILLGIGGIAYHLFRDQGWLSRGLGALWEAQYEAPIITTVLIVAAFFVFRALYKTEIGGKRDSKVPDFVLFAFIATGIFFLGRLLTTGHI